MIRRIRSAAYRYQHNAILQFVVSFAELLQQRAIILKVCGRQMCVVEVLPVGHVVCL